ncbi:unnamed protein product [Lactuca virosa]|uniref:RRM domain-containing protein n=1 Tax=Lactuca virosa TaxID=75947 RepID=A0AAU9LG26_9ASTR|nr:unnamed protein product [Lactuca virosa]
MVLKGVPWRKGFNFPIDFYPEPRSKSRFLDINTSLISFVTFVVRRLVTAIDTTPHIGHSNSEKLANLFNSAGVVDIAEVIYNRDTEQSRGFGFVTMSTVEEAEKAVEKFNGYDLSGRALIVNKAAPRGSQLEKRVVWTSFKIYVGNLAWQVDSERLEQAFNEHGKVVDARVIYDRESGKSCGFLSAS